MQVPHLYSRHTEAKSLGGSTFFLNGPPPSQQSSIQWLSASLKKSPSVCMWLWGHRVTQWGCPCSELLILGEAVLLAEEQAGPCDLSVLFFKALKMLLNIPKRHIPKEFRSLTLQGQNIIQILNHQMTINKEAGKNRGLRLWAPTNRLGNFLHIPSVLYTWTLQPQLCTLWTGWSYWNEWHPPELCLSN